MCECLSKSKCDVRRLEHFSSPFVSPYYLDVAIIDSYTSKWDLGIAYRLIFCHIKIVLHFSYSMYNSKLYTPDQC